MFVKTGDTVKIIAGKYKGETGEVTKVFPKENKVIVENINIVKKHVKPTGFGQEGGIVEQEAAIDASNVQLVDPETGEASRTSRRLSAWLESDWESPFPIPW